MSASSPLPPVGIVGFGNMGEALAAGLLHRYAKTRVMVLEQNAEAKAKALLQYKLPVAENLGQLYKESQILVIAVKPQDLSGVVGQLADLGFGKSGKGLISIAAGVKTSWFTQKLSSADVVRFMPNLAAKVGASLVGVSLAADCQESLAAQAQLIAGALGDAALVPEKSMAAVTGISGSGIAFVFRFLHALAMGGVREGLSYPQALAFALATADGAVKLLRETSEHPIAFES
ncbi:MAG: NAD(P)-binding domain-containing protein, partial [Spirochaetales bacterium]|nr:NAD(P)-binding domain-containing protein [Spirochaetales bacterium]